MNGTKIALVSACLLIGIIDLITTNIILSHGGDESNPFMHLAQTWLGPWWAVPKIGLTFVVMWLLSRAKSRRQSIIVVLLMATAPINNFIVISAMH